MSSGGVRLLVLVAALVLGLPVRAAPAGAEPARFRIEPEASELSFKATSRLVNADGRFHRFAGEVLADPKDLTRARVSVTVEAASLAAFRGPPGEDGPASWVFLTGSPVIHRWRWPCRGL